MRKLLSSIFIALSVCTWAVAPLPELRLNGAFVLDGAGATLDATSLPSSTGYFMESGNLNLSNITLQNFSTTGGTGSGGGAALGGALFLNSGVTAILNNVNFIGNTATGGIGGFGEFGGVLNGFLSPALGGSGATAVSGRTAYFFSALGNHGNGLDGYDGSDALDGTNGFGGAGGSGGSGSVGLPTYFEQIFDAATLGFQIVKVAADIAFDSAQIGELVAVLIEIVVAQLENVNPFLTGYPALEGIVDGTISALEGTQIAFDAADVTPYDIATLAAKTALLIGEQLTSYLLYGTSGNGGNGGNGGGGGNGSFGFGGGPGGNAGNGADAVAISAAVGGDGGIGGRGGNGGFGGGGGKGGDAGVVGNNGSLASPGAIASLAQIPGGYQGFGAGVGSFGNYQQPSPPAYGIGGGGGSGLGGAVFVASGATLDIIGPATFCGNAVLEGPSLNLGPYGFALGSDLFMMTGSTVNLNPGPGNTITFGGSISDDSVAIAAFVAGFVGTGADISIQSGLVIFDGVNTYSGQTLVSGGVLQAADGVGLPPESNLFLQGGILQGQGTMSRFLGTQKGRIQFAPGVSSGFSSAGGDFSVNLNCGATLVWGATPYFISGGIPLIFGSTSATNTVTLVNNIDLNNMDQTILVTAGPGNTNQAVLSGVISGGPSVTLTVGSPSYTGTLVLGGANTYTGPTVVAGGTLSLTGSLSSTSITIDAGATLIDVNSGFANGTALVVDGTFILEANDIVNDLTGIAAGVINLNGGTLTINSGNFPGTITGTNATNGITKTSVLNLTLGGVNVYIGPTSVLGGTLTLTGSLASTYVNIAPAAVLNDVNGGLSTTSTVNVDGTLLLGAAQTIGTLTDSGLGTGVISINLASLTVGGGAFSGSITGGNPLFGLFKNGPGTLTLTGVSTFVGAAEVEAGELLLEGLGALATLDVLIDAGAILTDLTFGGGLAAGATLTVDGTFNLGVDQTIATLFGTAAGLINLNAGSLSVGAGLFAGVIAGLEAEFGLIKISPGTLTLTGINTFVGPTDVNVGVLALVGTLASLDVNVALGAVLEDINGGLSAGATLTNNGTVDLFVDDSITLLVNTGTINGIGTLTAPTYELEGGSIINANLGLGTIISTGIVQLNGTSSANTINILSGTFTTGILGSRLLNFPNVTISAPGSLIIEGNEAIGGLFSGVITGNVNLGSNALSVSNGTFGGVISGTATGELVKISGGTLTLTGASTYIGPTFVEAGSLILGAGGSLLSPYINISLGATFEDVSGGLLSPTLVLDVGGTFLLDVNQTIPTLIGPSTGNVILNGGNVIINNGEFDGIISSVSPLLSLTKGTTGILTLGGYSTYLGPTFINEGTLILNGGLASLNVTVALGATFDDNGGPIGGLAAGALLTNSGIVNLFADNTITNLINTGIINGTATLTADTYNLDNGSVINANLGIGTINSNGIVQINGTSSASPINIITGTFTTGAPGGLLLLAPDINISPSAEFIITGNETINTLTGGGIVSLQSYQLTLNGGNYSGSITGNTISELVKNSAGTLILTGPNTYLGTTQVNEGTLILAPPSGGLQSEAINIAIGATFIDLTGNLSGLAVLTNNGTFTLGANDHVAAVINSGNITGIGFTLTAATYLLQNGSVVTANLGTGILTTTGNVTVSGTVGASVVNISAGSTLNLTGSQLLSNTSTVNVNGTLNLTSTFNQTINVLNGNGGSVIANMFQVNNGGTFNNGSINTTTSFTAGGGILNLNNVILNSPVVNLDSGATINFNGAGSVATTNTVTLNSNSNLNVSNNAIVNNSGNTTIAPNATLDVNTSGQYLNLGDITLSPNANLIVVTNGIVQSNHIITGINSTIIVPNSADLIYAVLSGSGTINSLGNTFVNNGIISGDLIFTNGFTNNGTQSALSGVVTIGGNYVNGGTVEFDITSTVPIIGYQQIRVSGTATLLPSSIFDVNISSDALVAGNYFQVIANSVGGPIAVGGILGTLSVTVNGAASSPTVLVWDAALGQLIATGIPPTPPGPPGPPVPPSPNPFFHLGCTSNQNRAAKAIFSAAFIGINQIDSSTVAGKLAQAILFSKNKCTSLSRMVPTYYGAIPDYAVMGDRALASKVWDRISTFSSLPEQCCPRYCRPKFSTYMGVIDSQANHFHKSDMNRQDIYIGVDFSNCRGFSIGAAATESIGKIHSHMGKSRADGNAGLFYIRKNLGKYLISYNTFSGSYQDHHMHRPTIFGHVKSHTKSQSYTINLGLQYKGWQSTHFAVSPRINAVYSHAHVNGFTEKGEIDALHDKGFHNTFVTGEIGITSLYCGKLFCRPLDIEATVGLEQPFKYHTTDMRVYVVDDSAIKYKIILPQSAKTRFNAGLNVGYNIFKAVTLYGSYEVISGGHWNHVTNAGVRIRL